MRSASTVVAASQITGSDPVFLSAGDVGDERVVDSVEGAQSLLDFAGVDGGTADFEHVVGSAAVEHEAVVVEMPEIAVAAEALVERQ